MLFSIASSQDLWPAVLRDGERQTAGREDSVLPKTHLFQSLEIGRAVLGPGHVAQLVRASSPYAKVESSISSQGTCQHQPKNA